MRIDVPSFQGPKVEFRDFSATLSSFDKHGRALGCPTAGYVRCHASLVRKALLQQVMMFQDSKNVFMKNAQLQHTPTI